MSDFDDNKHKCNMYFSVLIEQVPNIEYFKIAWLTIFKEKNFFKVNVKSRLSNWHINKNLIK